MTALPSKLLYQTKIEGSAARSIRSNIQPQNGTGTYYPNDIITINIPTRNNLVLVPSECYLKFTVTPTNSGAISNYCRLDSGGAHGLIQRIRIFSGSNLISDIDNYGLLAKMMMDIQVSSDASYGKFSVMSGTRCDLTTTTGTAGAVTSVFQTNSGYRFGDSTDANGVTTYAALAANTAVKSQTFCINLLSIIGSLCQEKYFPLFSCTSSPLRAEIQLVSNPTMAFCTSQPLLTFQITNCEYVAQMIELSDAAMSTIMAQSGGGPLQFAVTDFKNFSSTGNGQTSTNTNTTFTTPIAAKYSSLKSLFVATRDSALIGANTYFPTTSNKLNLQEYFFRIGAQTIPSKNPNSPPEMFSELMKSIGSIGDVGQQPSIDYYAYNQDYPQVNAETAVGVGIAQSGSFYVGLDLENYSGADRSTIFAGWNSNTDDIYFNTVYGKTDVARTIRFDAYAMFDSVVVCENNTCYVKF